MLCALKAHSKNHHTGQRPFMVQAAG